MISKYRHFPRNIDSLGDRAKKRNAFQEEYKAFAKYSVCFGNFFSFIKLSENRQMEHKQYQAWK